jgi:F-type H+-transporting ATPase subunit epsilon
MGLRLAIVTPARPLVDAEVDSVVAPGREGEFGVLPGPEHVLAALRPGVLRYVSGGRESRVAIAGGFAEVRPDAVAVLASAAALPQEIDRAQVQRELEAAETALAQLGSHAPPEQVEAARERADTARARLAVASARGESR